MEIVAENNKEIETVRSKLQNEMDLNSFPNKFKKIQEEVDALDKAMHDFKIRKFRRNKRDYTNDRVYKFPIQAKSKRVSWAGKTYSDFESADGDESTGASGDEGPSYHSTYERAAKGKAREHFFQMRPQWSGRQKAL